MIEAMWFVVGSVSCGAAILVWMDFTDRHVVKGVDRFFGRTQDE